MLLDVFVISTFNNKIVHRIQLNLCKIFRLLLNVENYKQIKKTLMVVDCKFQITLKTIKLLNLSKRRKTYYIWVRTDTYDTSLKND